MVTASASVAESATMSAVVIGLPRCSTHRSRPAPGPPQPHIAAIAPPDPVEVWSRLIVVRKDGCGVPQSRDSSSVTSAPGSTRRARERVGTTQDRRSPRLGARRRGKGSGSAPSPATDRPRLDGLQPCLGGKCRPDGATGHREGHRRAAGLRRARSPSDRPSSRWSSGIRYGTAAVRGPGGTSANPAASAPATTRCCRRTRLSGSPP